MFLQVIYLSFVVDFHNPPSGSSSEDDGWLSCYDWQPVSEISAILQELLTVDSIYQPDETVWRTIELIENIFQDIYASQIPDIIVMGD